MPSFEDILAIPSKISLLGSNKVRENLNTVLISEARFVSFMTGKDEFRFCSTHTSHQTRHGLPHARTTSGNFFIAS